MPIEIERKYLLRDNSWKGLADGVLYKQGYIFASNDKSVRIRIVGEKAYLTIKASKAGIVRDEFEYEIPLKDAHELLENHCNGKIIEKTRYKITYENMEWEIDEFHGQNQGLVIAEIELSDASQNIIKPVWIGEEVSNEMKYYNSNLIDYPFCEWPS